LSERDDFGMCSWIAIDLPPIMPPPDDQPARLMHDHAPNRHLVQRASACSLNQRFLHPRNFRGLSHVYVQWLVRSSRHHAIRLNDRDNCGNLRHFLAQIPFDAHLERHGAAGAAVAGAVETDMDDPVLFDVNQLDIAPIRLDGRPNQVDHALNPLANSRHR
jgi:hypothetical protein